MQGIKKVSTVWGQERCLCLQPPSLLEMSKAHEWPNLPHLLQLGLSWEVEVSLPIAFVLRGPATGPTGRICRAVLFLHTPAPDLECLGAAPPPGVTHEPGWRSLRGDGDMPHADRSWGGSRDLLGSWRGGGNGIFLTFRQVRLCICFPVGSGAGGRRDGSLGFEWVPAGPGEDVASLGERGVPSFFPFRRN